MIDCQLLEPGTVDLQQNVRNIQRNAEIGVKYMQAWEEKILDRQEALAEGMEIGKAEGFSGAVLELLTAYGEIPGELCSEITRERDQETLLRWLRLAAGVGSIREFAEKYRA